MEVIEVTRKVPRKNFVFEVDTETGLGLVDGKAIGFTSKMAVHPAIYEDDSGIHHVCMKIEKIGKKDYSQLGVDIKCLELLWAMGMRTGLPEPIMYATRDVSFGGKPARIAVTSRLGLNLQQILAEAGGTLPYPEVLRLTKEMVERVRDLHTIGAHVHRDVKPSNFLLGFPDTPEQDTVHIIDFGLAQPISQLGGVREPMEGTPEYMPRAVHAGAPNSDNPLKDDLEAIAYVAVYLMMGSLPWSDLVKEPWARHGKKATPQLLRAKEEAARGELEALNDASPEAAIFLVAYMAVLDHGDVTAETYDNLISMLSADDALVGGVPKATKESKATKGGKGSKGSKAAKKGSKTKAGKAKKAPSGRGRRRKKTRTPTPSASESDDGEASPPPPPTPSPSLSPSPPRRRASKRQSTRNSSAATRSSLRQKRSTSRQAAAASVESIESSAAPSPVVTTRRTSSRRRTAKKRTAAVANESSAESSAPPAKRPKRSASKATKKATTATKKGRTGKAAAKAGRGKAALQSSSEASKSGSPPAVATRRSTRRGAGSKAKTKTKAAKAPVRRSRRKAAEAAEVSESSETTTSDAVSMEIPESELHQDDEDDPRLGSSARRPMLRSERRGYTFEDYQTMLMEAIEDLADTKRGGATEADIVAWVEHHYAIDEEESQPLIARALKLRLKSGSIRSEHTYDLKSYSPVQRPL